MFGRLTEHALKQDYIEYAAGLFMFLSTLALIGIITYTGRWKWLWREWITSLDPKRIGVMYLAVAFLMLTKGLVDALMMRAQQAFAVGSSQGYLEADHFQQIFTAHGTTMIFFVAMGIVFTLFNLIIPLQIGARDVAFPFLNSISFWLFAAGSIYILLSLVIGKFSGAGWVGYPPLSAVKYNPGVGVDYWIWSVQIAGIGSLLSGINFLVTILKLRCPKMGLMKMPIFVWSALCASILIIFAFPILTATLAMLTADRMLGMHFFTAGNGGNLMMYVNLIWAWGHPEVYILILPAFGVFSEIVPTFSQKRLFGYTSMVLALVAITLLSFIVWLHHFFTMGAGSNVNAFFSIMTMLIAIPTGVKIFNWLFTMYQGRVRYQSPMLWFLGFVLIFTIGGMAGILLSIAPIDFQFHNSLFLVAHFHSVIIGGVVFAFFAAFTYWFPKFAGFRLNERLGVWAFWGWFAGFLTAFLPLYILGFMGATRRLNHYPQEMGWQPYFLIAGIGILLIFAALGLQILQVAVSIYERNKRRDETGNPWGGTTLEWTTSSPPPFYNFAATPNADGTRGEIEEIVLPKNSSIGFFIGMCAFGFGFGMVWHIFWLSAASLALIVILIIIRTWTDDHEFILTKDEVERLEKGGIST